MQEIEMKTTKKVALARDGKMICIVLRGDEAAALKIGQKFKYGSGKCWKVMDKER
jgi:hypothetical protein